MVRVTRAMIQVWMTLMILRGDGPVVPMVGNRGITFSLCSGIGFRGQEMTFLEVSGDR
jgi:hypothetical protein